MKELCAASVVRVCIQLHGFYHGLAGVCGICVSLVTDVAEEYLCGCPGFNLVGSWRPTRGLTLVLRPKYSCKAFSS